MNEIDRQLIRDIQSAVQTLSEKAEEFNDDVNSGFDIDDARLCYQEVKEALDAVNALLTLMETPDDDETT